MSRSTKLLIALLLGIGVGLALLIVQLVSRAQQEDAVIEPAVLPITQEPVTPPKVEPTPAPETPKSLPEQVLLELPFTSQAPFAVWDAIHKEACEEASLLMVRSVKKSLPLGYAQAVDNELKRFINWQTDNGYSYDLTVQQLQDTASAFYALEGGKIIDNPTLNEIKQALAAGSLVIVPAAGRALHNPYFTPPGPNYHMLVLRGYNATEFITNDPGTKRGQELRYSHQVLLDAIHDYTPGDITKGKKRVLVY